MSGGGSRPYRAPAPLPAQRIRWPAAFGTRFTVFVDVEEEFDWSAPPARDQRATTAMGAFPAAHRRFADRAVPLTCMVDHPVATDPRSIDILRAVMADGRSTIGVQLHAWVTPPFDEPLSAANSYAGNLPPGLEAAKIDTMTHTIEAAFGVSPLVYRAGRYGIGPDTMALLAARGYRVDSSVRARYDYGGDGGPDFSAVGAAAYRDGAMVELPLTTLFTGAARRGGAGLYRLLGRVPHGRGLFARAGLLSRIALTPEDMPVAAALEAIEIAVGEGLRLLTLSFHSPSLVPGHTPYVRDAADRRAFDRWWDAVLDRFDRLGVGSASLAEIVAAADRGRTIADDRQGTPTT